MGRVRPPKVREATLPQLEIISEDLPRFTHRLLFFNYVIFFKWSVPFCPFQGTKRWFIEKLRKLRVWFMSKFNAVDKFEFLYLEYSIQWISFYLLCSTCTHSWHLLCEIDRNSKSTIRKTLFILNYLNDNDLFVAKSDDNTILTNVLYLNSIHHLCYNITWIGPNHCNDTWSIGQLVSRHSQYGTYIVLDSTGSWQYQ